MKITVNGKNRKPIQKETLKLAIDLENSFTIKLAAPIVINLHPTRMSYNERLSKDTQDWEVGNTSEDDTIDIIHPDSFERFSSHKKEEFYPILKHELAHIFIRKLSSGKTTPVWLDEGLANCLAGQATKYFKQPLHVEKRFLEILSTQIGWDQHAGYSGYAYSCLFVDFLIKKYSLTKVLDLIKNSKKIFDLKSFRTIFKKTFNTSLELEENKFVDSL